MLQQACLPPPPTPGEMGAAAATGVGQAAGEAAASRAGHSAPGGMAGQIGGKIAGSLFNRRKKEASASAESAPAASQAPTAPGVSTNNRVTPLRITSERISINQDFVPSTTFEVPAGFKKVAGGN